MDQDSQKQKSDQSLLLWDIEVHRVGPKEGLILHSIAQLY